MQAHALALGPLDVLLLVLVLAALVQACRKIAGSRRPAQLAQRRA